jgi:hypothetical protein
MQHLSRPPAVITLFDLQDKCRAHVSQKLQYNSKLCTFFKSDFLSKFVSLMNNVIHSENTSLSYGQFWAPPTPVCQSGSSIFTSKIPWSTKIKIKKCNKKSAIN